MPKLHSADRKEAQNRLKEKIEKEYVVNEAERYLKRARDDLSNKVHGEYVQASTLPSPGFLLPIS